MIFLQKIDIEVLLLTMPATLRYAAIGFLCADLVAAKGSE
jgi:hypothetical protein